MYKAAKSFSLYSVNYRKGDDFDADGLSNSVIEGLVENGRIIEEPQVEEPQVEEKVEEPQVEETQVSDEIFPFYREE